MRIIIFSDSLGRPRPDLPPEERTEYEETYPYLLRRHFNRDEVEIIYIESLESDEGIFWNERMVCFRRPDIVIYHLGVNDCAPRVVRKNSQSIIFKPWFRRVTKDVCMRVIHRYRRYLILTVLRGKVHVPIERFESNFRRMLADLHQYAPKCRAIALGISLKPAWYDYRSPGVNVNINRYNNRLKEVFGQEYLDVNSLNKGSPEDLLISDGLHFKNSTHQKIAQLLIAHLETP